MKPRFSETSKQGAFFVLLVAIGVAVGWLLIPAPTDTRSHRGGSGGVRSAPGVPLSQGQVVEIVEADFDRQVLGSPLPVMVDFAADWCGPCQQIAPVLDALARETAGARFVRVDVDENPGLAQRYGVTAIPRLMVFKNGQVVSDTTGTASATELKAMLGL